MWPDRRGFLRLVAGALTFLSCGAWAARDLPGALDVHRATRNPQRRKRLARSTPRPAPFKPYPGSERTPLPRIGSAPGTSLAAAVRSYATGTAFREGELSLAQLGELLYLANGMTGWEPGRRRRHDHRAAPSAGALYGGEVYVVAERVRNLPAGVYYYGVRGHALVGLRRGSFLDEAARALEQPASVENAAAIVLITNVFGRYERRYLDRGYRYALLDTGHIAENLRLALGSAGLAEAGPLRFDDDRLHELIQVDGRREAVCALHAIGLPGEARPELAGLRLRLVEKRLEGATLPTDASVPERYHEATKLVPGAGASKEPPKPRAGRRASPDGSGLDLPQGKTTPPRAVENAIRRRCSARRFVPDPISLEDLGFVVEMARGHAALERTPGVDLHLAVHAVRGLSRGLYRYEPESHRLVPTRAGDLRVPLTRVCLGQKRAGVAAVGLLMVGRIEEATARRGDRSYRDLLIEAGAVGQRVYLAAGAIGLGARNLSAFTDDALNALLGFDGRREAVLHLTLLGRLAAS